MSDLAELVVVVVALYLAECFMWVRRGAVAFCSRGGAGGGGRHRIAHGSAALGNNRGGLLFLDPLPPIGSAFVSYAPAISLDAHGAYSYTAQTIGPHGPAEQPGKYFALEEIRGIAAVSGEIRINGELFADVGDAAIASRYVTLLEQLRRASPDGRDALIDQSLAAATDLDAIRAARQRYMKKSAALRWAAHGLFVLMLVALPVVIIVPSLFRFWLEWLLLTVLCLLAVVVLFYRAHRALHPASAGERWMAVAEMILLPLAGIRAPATLSRHVLAHFHPLATAAVLCDEVTFTSFARRVLLDLRYPLRKVVQPQSDAERATEQSSRTRLAAALESVVRRAGHEPVVILRSPAPNEASSRSFCPRCDTQYVVPEGVCADCGGISLQPIDRPPADSAAA